MRSLLVTAVMVSLVACGGTTGRQSAASPPAHVHTASPTEIPRINVDDMMGFYAQQTVFVATTDHVSAVTLLNHFTRYQIPTSGVAQVSIDRSGQWLYLLDGATPDSYRLRVFDVPSGRERAVRAGIAGVAADRHALATAGDGRVLMLKSDPHHTWVDAYDAVFLQPLGPVMEYQGCGDRLLASSIRLAIVCLATGEIAIDDLRGNHATIDGSLPDLVAAAMAENGTLYVATAEQHFATVASGATKLVSIPWPSEWSGTVVSDGLAVAQGGASAVIAERTDDGAWVRVIGTGNPAERKSHRLAGVPQGGIVVMWPFAYYAVDRTIRHVDLNSGLLETMTEVGGGAMPGAVANR